jgi:glutathione S-transferase
MRTLYHYPTSPFSRRVRLALAHKRLPCDLKDARSNPAEHEKMKALWPLRTAPVFVDDDGQAMGDSGAIVRYLDAAYPSPRVWPEDAPSMRAAAEVAALVDGALDNIINTGTRFYDLRADAAWAQVRGEFVGRAQAALDGLSNRVKARGPRPLTDAGWCAADIWLFTAVRWFHGLPARAADNPKIAQVMTLAWALPGPLVTWSEAFLEREDVRALG